MIVRKVVTKYATGRLFARHRFGSDSIMIKLRKKNRSLDTARRALVVALILLIQFALLIATSSDSIAQERNPLDRPPDQTARSSSSMKDQQWSSLNSIWGTGNQSYLRYNTNKKDDVVQLEEPPPPQKGGFSLVWQFITQVVSALLGLVWDFADYVLRPIVQSLIEHMLVMLHNPNVASTIERKMPVWMTGTDADIPYDLVNLTTKEAIRQGFDINRAIAINLLLLLFIISIWKYWTEAAWKNGHNLMGAVGRLIATTGLILGWPIVSCYLVETSNEMIDFMFKGIDPFQLHKAVTRVVGLGIAGGATTLFASIAGGIAAALGPAVYIGGLTNALGGTVYFAFLGVTVFMTVHLVVLKAVQTALMLAQFMFAPIFLVFFAYPATERIAATFIRSCVEVSLWTFIWCGMLRLLVIVLQPGDDGTIWGQGIMMIGVLQLMIQVPGFVAQAQISPVSEFLSPRGAMNTLGSMFQGVSELAKFGTKMYKASSAASDVSQKDAVQSRGFNRGDGDSGPGGPGGEGSPPPRVDNPPKPPSAAKPEDIGHMSPEQLGNLLASHSLNAQQKQAAKKRLDELTRDENLSPSLLSPQAFAALSSLMDDAAFAKNFAAARGDPGLTAGHLAELARSNLSDSKRQTLKDVINAQPAAALANLNPRQLAAIGPLLNATDDLATALANEPEKLASLLPAVDDRSFDRMMANPGVAATAVGLRTRQLAKFSPDRLAKIASHVSDSDLLNPEFLAALSNDQLKGIANEFDRPSVTNGQKRGLARALSGSQLKAIGEKLAPAFTDLSGDDLADLEAEKLTGLGEHLSDTQLAQLAVNPKLTDAKLAALAPQLKNPASLRAFANALAGHPTLSNFKPETLGPMFANLDGNQIAALTPALGLNAAHIKAIAGNLKSAKQVASFAAALDADPEGQELCSTLINELSDDNLAHVPREFGQRLTSKEIDSLNPKKLARIASTLGQQQVASLSNQKMEQIAASLEPDERIALADHLSGLTNDQRAILVPASLARARQEAKPISLRAAIDHIVQNIEEEDTFVGTSSDGEFHVSVDKRGRLYLKMPENASRSAKVSYLSQVALAQMWLYNMGAREAVAEAYESERGTMEPSIESSEPSDQPAIMTGMLRVAMSGARAMLAQSSGNQYTAFLQSNSEPITEDVFAAEVQRVVDPSAPDNPFSKNYFNAKAQAGRVLSPSEMTPQRVRWIQQFINDGNSVSLLSSAGDVDMLGLIYGSGGSIGEGLLGKGGSVADVYRATNQLQQQIQPSYTLASLPPGMPQPRLVVGQATYTYLLDHGQANFDPKYNQFDQTPDAVPPMQIDRMNAVIPIYLKRGITLEQLAIPDVAFSIRAIDSFDPELHESLAKGISVVGPGPGVSPGLAVVVQQAERHGNLKLSKEILTAAEHKLSEMENRAIAGAGMPATHYPNPDNIKESLLHGAKTPLPRGDFAI